ncbi:MAG: hypothetical protein JNJ54_11965 [Myxococcaceae bacterium]|nr:hypothetical protein [Myxococcaceae bacterium]
MRRPVWLFLAVVGAACQVPAVIDAGSATPSGGGGGGGAGAQAGGTAGGVGAGGGAPGDAGLHPAFEPGVAVQHDVFATGRVCGECHSSSATSTANRDEQGRSVDLFEWWSASAMGNSARDPLFRAVLASEQARAPAAAAAISTVCLTCHTPMAKLALERSGGLPATLANTVYAAGPVGALARDGISCTLCHQIQPTDLGLEASFSAGFRVTGAKQIFGPFPGPFANPMVGRTGFTPVQGAHVQSSAMCGTCHALVTEALTPEGVATGHRMGEQLTYLEWRRSAFSTEGGGTTPQSCQDCHMPDRQANGQPLSTRLARRPEGGDFPPVSPRGPFSRHSFVGANTLLPKLLRQGRALLTPEATDAALLEAEQRSRELLRTQTAKLTLSNVARVGARVELSVRVESLTGHKVPSGYPSRRLFLEVQVFDASGSRVSATGLTDAAGRLVGDDGQPLPEERVHGPTFAHRSRVTSAREPMVWEAVMSDGHGHASFALLGAEGFLKDNRLLPRGHQDTTVGPLSTAPVGVTDADFLSGSDAVQVSLPAPPVGGRVDARLRYQTFHPRYLDEQLERDSPEVAALRTLLVEGMLAPEVVDEVSVPLP